jgi:hypothetical protein
MMHYKIIKSIAISCGALKLSETMPDTLSITDIDGLVDYDCSSRSPGFPTSLIANLDAALGGSVDVVSQKGLILTFAIVSFRWRSPYEN